MPRVALESLELEYQVEGRSGGDLVVLSTGFGDQLTMWPNSMKSALVDKGFRVVSFDTRDAGLSSDSFGYDLDDLASDLISIIEANAASRAHVIGYSMGGQIAMRAALRNPGKIKSLVILFSTSGAPDLPYRSVDAITASLGVCTRMQRAEAIEARLNLIRLANGPRYRMVDRTALDCANAYFDRAYRPEGAARHLSALRNAQPIHESLGNLKVPALVIQASDDCFFAEEHGVDLSQRLGAQYTMIEGAGHNLTEELGQVVAEISLPFIQRVSRVPDA